MPSGPEVLRIERTVLVEIQVVPTSVPPVHPPGSREIRPDMVKLVYAGNGYCQVEVRGRAVSGFGHDGGYWTHVEGRPSDPGNVRDTAHAPEWLRELAEAYAPSGFTATS